MAANLPGFPNFYGFKKSSIATPTQEAVSYEHAYERSLEYFRGEELAAKTYVDKYALRNKENQILEPTPDFMHRRLASEFARIDYEKYGLNFGERFDVYYGAMRRFARIVPQGSPMAAIGNQYQVMSASNCVVVASPEDSVEGIFKSALDLAQLYKRRCVAVGSSVVTKEKGVLSIENVEPGMHILSYDLDRQKTVYNKILDKFESDVEKDDRIIIRYSNGTELRTSKKHPVLEVGEYGLGYVDAGKINLGSINVRPEPIDLSALNTGDWDPNTTEEHELAWFVGAHIGDGSADRVVVGDNRGRYDRIRFRISGDNEEVIEHYKNIHNSLTKNSSNYHESYRKDYQTTCWEFSSAVVGNETIASELLENQIGSKTYSAFVPSFIDSDFKMWSFIAGLIDTDGTIKGNGQQIVIGICAKDVINQVAVFLQSKGVSTHLFVRDDVRENESTIHQLAIHYNMYLWDGLAQRLSHDEKRNALRVYLSEKMNQQHSLRKPITQKEYNHIIHQYDCMDKDWKNPYHKLLAANIYYMKKADVRGVGKAFLDQLVDLGFFSHNEAATIISRTSVVEVVRDTESEKYYDIEVENTNNFYCGNGGLVVIHNCGVGIDISTLRPDGMPVNNAARTTTGAWSFADLFSEVTLKIGQCVAKGERVLTQRGMSPIEDVCPNTDSVWTKKGWIRVDSLHHNGHKKVFRLQSSEGFSIRASADHIFLTEEDGELKEKRLGDFEVDDPIVLIPGTFGWSSSDGSEKFERGEYIKKRHNNSNRLNEDVKLPDQMDGDVAYILGQMYGDGSIEYDRFNEPLLFSIACAHDHPAVEKKLCNAIRNVFGVEPTVKKGDGAVNKIEVHSKVICNWLNHNNILKEKSESIRVPSKILYSCSLHQMSFLAGFFDADGTNGKGKKGYTFTTVSGAFAQDVQTMLMANGIISKIHIEPREHKGWRDLYSVSITGAHAQSRLMDLYHGHVFDSAKIYEDFVAKRDNYLTPFKAKTLGVTHGQYSFVPDNSQYLSANAYLKLPENMQDELLIRSSVASIDEDGEEETYDLTLPEENMFWCEGFYIHNSGRRGALMITIDVHHPDVVKFAKMKSDLGKVTGANVSIRLSDEFLQAVEDDTKYEQRWPCEGTPKIKQMVSAREVWNDVVDCATRFAEPGLILWGQMLENLPAHSYPQFKTLSTNPCSEIALSAYDSCRLISLNLTGYVRNAFNANAYFDYAAFVEDVGIAMQMGDNLVDLELELIDRIKDIIGRDDEVDLDVVDQALIPEQIKDRIKNKYSQFSEVKLWDKLREAGRLGRRTGIGTHGLGDTFAQLQLVYDSPEAHRFVDEVYRKLRDTAYKTSSHLAKVRGPFPAWDWKTEKNNAYIKRLPEHIKRNIEAHGRRNISILTQAPTGSVSIVSKCGAFDSYNISSGVEPIFRTAYTRRKKINEGDDNVKVDYIDDKGVKWQEFEVFHANYREFVKLCGKKPNVVPAFFKTSDKIDWKERIRIQGIEQQYIDHSISSTINLPRGTSSEVVKNLYMMAWHEGLKGITVYVEGSRDGVLVSDDEKKRIKELESKIADLEAQLAAKPVQMDVKVDVPEPGAALPNTRAPKRPKVLESKTHKIKLDFGDTKPRNAYVTVSFFPNTRRPYEILIIAPYNGLSEKDLQILELAARTTSMNLRHGLPLQFICEQLDKIGGQYIHSIPTNIARVLRQYLPESIFDEAEDTQETVPETMSPKKISMKELEESLELQSETPPTLDGTGLMKCPKCGERAYQPSGVACGTCMACGHVGCG